MQHTISTIIAIFMAGVLLFIVPLVTLTDRNDNVTQENIKLIVEEFVTEVRNTGKMTRDKFQEFENRLDSSGNNSYLIEIELKYLDENPGKKTSQTNYTKIGENVYYSEYTTQILRKLGIKTGIEDVDPDDDTILLKQGDFIVVNVKNANRTAAQTLKGSLFSFSNAGEYVISASSSGMITVNGEKDYILLGDDSADTITKSRYTVKYNPIGGNGAPEEQIKQHGQQLELSNDKPHKEGYTFMGWATNSVATEAVYQPGDIYTTNKDLTLYAKWEPNPYTISYDSNGGSGAPNKDTQWHDQGLVLSNKKPIRTGYEFMGWGLSKTTPTVSYMPGDVYSENKARTLYAVWQKIYIITYEANKGKDIPDKQVKIEDVPIKLSDKQPTKEGYIFKGWKEEKDGNIIKYQPGDLYEENKDITLYAHWELITYAVTYNKGTGDTVENMPIDQIKEDIENLILSERIPTRTGYNFLGWSKTRGGTQVDYSPGEEYTKNEPLTLYAVWQIQTYLVEYDVNGANRVPASQTKYHGTALTLHAAIPTLEGYKFKGWKSSETGKIYQPEEKFEENNNTTLIAQWGQNTYTLTYFADGGDGEPAVQYKEHGEIIELNKNMPTKKGNAFKGWKSSATGTIYQAGASFEENNDTTLVAQWEESTLTINYYSNHATESFDNPKNAVAKNKNVIVETAQFKYSTAYSAGLHNYSTKDSEIYLGRTGHTATGEWGTSKTGGNKVHENEDFVSGQELAEALGETLVDGDKEINVYAQWNIKSYTITYNANTTDTVSNLPSSQKANYEETITLPSPKRTGYSFAGWKKGTAIYDAGEEFKVTGNVTFTAQWEIKTYTITYNANSGTVDPTSQTAKYGEEITLPTPTRTGYTFRGWIKGSTTYDAGVKFIVTGNATFTAQWEIKTYTITYNANEGTVSPTSQTVNHGDTITLPTPTRTGYTFTGWKKGTATYDAGEEFTVTGTATFIAQWELDTVTLTNLVGSDSISMFKAWSDSGYATFSDSKSFTTVAGHRYYVRVGWSGYSYSYGDGWSYKAEIKAGTTSLITKQPSVQFHSNSSTKHDIIKAASSSTTISLTGSRNMNSQGSANATIYMLVDLTELEEKTGEKYTAETFWSEIGSKEFYGTKTIEP